MRLVRAAHRVAREVGRQLGFVKYCSTEGCAHGVDETGLRLEASIAALLKAGARDATISPSDAKAVGGEQ